MEHIDKVSFQLGAFFTTAVAASWPWVRRFIVMLAIFAAKKAGEQLIRQYIEQQFKKKKS